VEAIFVSAKIGNTATDTFFYPVRANYFSLQNRGKPIELYGAPLTLDTTFFAMVQEFHFNYYGATPIHPLQAGHRSAVLDWRIKTASLDWKPDKCVLILRDLRSLVTGPLISGRGTEPLLLPFHSALRSCNSLGSGHFSIACFGAYFFSAAGRPLPVPRFEQRSG